MSRDYGARQAVGRKSKATNQGLLIALSFLLGYLTASFLSIDSLSHWLNSQVLAYQEAKPEPTPVAPKKSHPRAKPKFEFYTLLSNEKSPAHPPQSNPESPTVDKTQTQVATAQPQPANVKAAEVPKLNPSKVVVKAPPVRVEQAKVTPPSRDKGAFQIQVASFKARKDAEHMKALLTLKGYEVSVASITNPTGNWFRVLIGPYPNRTLAQKAQIVLSRSERLHGMVRCVGG